MLLLAGLARLAAVTLATTTRNLAELAVLCFRHALTLPYSETGVNRCTLIGMKRWLAAALGAGLLGAAAVLASTRKRGRRRLGEPETIDQVPSGTLRHIEGELEDAEQRARGAGATGKLEYIGAGMTGIVFCDARERAYKVARHDGKVAPMLADEAEMMRLAAKMPGVGKHIARGVHFDRKHSVLVRECVRGKVGGWKDGAKLRDLHERMGKELEPYGWTAPEYKEDSYVIARGRGPVLVDASMAHKVGRVLVKDVLDVLNNRRPISPDRTERFTDLAFALRMERGRTIPAPIADRLLRRLKDRDPAVELARD